MPNEIDILKVRNEELIDEIELAQQREHRAHRSYRELVTETEEEKAKMLRQIQNLLVANHTIKRREEIAIEELEKLLYPKTVDKQKVGKEVW